MKKSFFALVLLLCTAVCACTPDDAAAKRIKVSLRPAPSTFTLGVYGSTGPSGWSSFSPSADTNIIYVSNSVGVDASGGTAGTVGNPIKTLAWAVDGSKSIGSLGASGGFGLRNGYPDWVLLKKGDTWTDENFGYVTASGRSTNEPQVFGSYDPTQPTVVNPSVGKARPQLKVKWNVSTIAVLGSLHAGDGNFRDIIGLDFYAYTRDPGNVDYDFATITNELNVLAFFGVPTYTLVEDCKFNFTGFGVTSPFAGNVALTEIPDFILRRSVLANNYNIAPFHAAGIFWEGILRPLIEENIFDHNGWNGSVVGGGRTAFNHNVYLGAYNGPVTYRGNISTRASNVGSQLRSGGTVYNNFHAQDPIAALVRTVPTNYYSNVLTEGIDPGVGGIGNSWGIAIRGSGDTTSIHDNILSNAISSPPDYSILVDSQPVGLSLTLANPAVITYAANAQGDADIYLQNGNAVSFTTSGTLPASIVAGTTYYVVNVSANGLVFNISATLGGSAISTNGQSQSGSHTMSIKTQNDSVNNNVIYHWAGAPTDNGINTTLSGNVIDGAGYPAPARTIGTYAGTLGQPATLDGFMGVALGMNKDTWNPSYTADGVNTYVRAGFGQ